MRRVAPFRRQSSEDPVVPAERLKLFWNNRMLLEGIESAVTTEGCNHTSIGNLFGGAADAGSYRHA